MSLTLDPPPAPAPAGPPGRPPGRARTWARVALAVALLGASAATRSWQQGRIDRRLRSGWTCPFDLASLPKRVGPWTGEDAQLDPWIARATGAAAFVHRSYVNEETGVRLGLIALYGPAAKVFIHQPQLCYSVAGFAIAEGLAVQPIACGDRAAPFGVLTFARGEGGQRERHRVYYAWRHDGWWAPDDFIQKRAERIPGMFKLHLDRPLGPGEKLGAADPCRDFLELFLPEFERRLAAAAADRPGR